jgi:hypothetical protein
METSMMICTKIASVKRLNQNNPRWVKDKQKGVSKIAKQRLNDNLIYTVVDLHGLHFKEILIVKIAKRTEEIRP